MRSGSIGRLRIATEIDFESLSRSNRTLRPERLMTVSSRSCTRSNVVKRPPQSEQIRRRRIAAFSSEGRLSLTWLSSLPQNGQRIVHFLLVARRQPPRFRRDRFLFNQKPDSVADKHRP